MQPADDIKTISLRISDRLHRSMKADAARRGITIEAAYAEAASQWLAPPSDQPGYVPVFCPPHMEPLLRNMVATLSRPGVFEQFKANAEQGVVRDAREPDEENGGTKQ